MRTRPPFFETARSQPSLPLDGPRLAALTPTQRAEAVALLAALLLEASGATPPEGDDGRA